MNLLLDRKRFSPRSTGGDLYVNGQWECYTLEDTYRLGDIHVVKVPGQTAIPIGTYRVTLDWSKRFRATIPHILDVPGFVGVRIHAGNTVADTEGCILVGNARTEDKVLLSRAAYDVLVPKIRGALADGEAVTIEVTGVPAVMA